MRPPDGREWQRRFTTKEWARLAEWRRAERYSLATYMPDGRIVCLLATLLGGGQIVIGDFRVVHERYSYSSLQDATDAYDEWRRRQWSEEPVGWIRHQPSNRRRTNGDPAKETTRP